MHTPGPWELYNEDLRGGSYWVVAIPGPDFETIDLHVEENGEANARLISAAPEMYAALRLAMADARGWDYLTDETRHAIAAAIVKAREPD